MTIQAAIQHVVEGRDLSEAGAAEVAGALIRGEASAAQIAALLVALRMKGETAEEITGFARAVRAGAARIEVGAADLVDTCGTGGSGSGAFNVSTVAAFVAAGAGCAVAKHGNRAISSKSGSADLLEALGVSVEMAVEETARCIAELGIGFLFAPQYHPGARHAAVPRREIGVRTLFNVLGPLVNPAGARRQVMGVYARALVEPIAEVLRRLGAEHALVVHGTDGLDEISTTGPTWVAELKGGAVATYEVTPEEFGLARVSLVELVGGAAADNARQAQRILAGEAGALRDFVVVNAAAAIYVGGKSETLAAGVSAAQASIDSGRAAAKLAALVRRSASAAGA